MSRWMIIALAACGGGAGEAGGPTVISNAGSSSQPSTVPTTLVPPGRPSDGHVWVIGFAQNAKAGAILDTGELPIYVEGRDSWPADLQGRPQILEGTLTTVHHGSMTDANGNQMGGIPGDQLVLAGSKAPPSLDDGLQAAEQDLVKAFVRRDRPLLEQIISSSFQLHVNGKVRTRDNMLTSILVPEVEAIEVTRLASHRNGDVGIVTGLQTAKVRDKGQLVDDVTYFVDVFEHHGDRWVLTTAYAK